MGKFTPEKEIAAKQGEPRPEDQELRREPLPELELTELLKSEKPINEIESAIKLFNNLEEEITNTKWKEKN